MALPGVDVDDIIAVIGSGTREVDHTRASSETSYREAPPSLLRLACSQRYLLQISKAPFEPL